MMAARRPSPLAATALVVAALVVAALAGCGTPALDRGAAPDARLGYVYGGLQLAASGEACEPRAGLVLRAVDGAREYVLELSRTLPVSVFAVEPGRYAIRQLVFMSCDGLEVGRRDFDSPSLEGAFSVAPMTASYLGEYEGRTSIEVERGTLTRRWRMVRLCRDFAAATGSLVDGFPGLAVLRRLDATNRGPRCRRLALAG